MKFKNLLSPIASYRAMACMSLIYVVVVAAATFIESFADTTSARVLIYNSWWFIALQAVMVVNFVAIARRRALYAQRKFGALLLHYGFAVILAGAITTHMFGSEGVMMIREGESSNQMLTSECYFTAKLINGNSSANTTKEHQVRYGKLTKRPFAISFNDPHIRVSMDGYHVEHNGAERLTMRIEDGDRSSTVEIVGGKYRYSAPIMVPLADGAQLQLSYGSKIVELPFHIKLRDFILTRYPGSSSPSSYSSDVLIENSKGEVRPYNIYMNKIAYVGSYRVYQTSYDPDELGTVLTVNHDMAGTVISYLGYIMLALGLVLSILHEGSRFRGLYRRLTQISAMALLLAMPTIAQGALPRSVNPSILDRDLAYDFAHLLVQSPDGRIEPVHTYAQKMVRKITGESTFEELTPEQYFLAILADPISWGEVAMVEVGNEELLSRIPKSQGDYVAYANLFDNDGAYILTSEVERVYAKAAQERNGYEKEVLKLDEKANILNSLFHATMFSIFPLSDDVNGRWLSMGDDLSLLTDSRDSMFAANILPWFYSEALRGNHAEAREVIGMIDTYQRAKADDAHLITPRKVSGEVFYNRSHIFKRVGLGYLALGSVMLILLFVALLRGTGESRFMRRAVMVLGVALIAAFLVHTFGIALRWYISGRAPWTNSYESMVYVGWSAMLMGVWFVRRSPVATAIAAIMAGAVVMISHLNLMDPQITPLVPVLKSYWLMSHVASITASYGFFGVSALIGLSVMAIYALGGGERLKLRIEELTIINEMAITIGLILLTIGIFIGAIWANESWGRYWGWDPKESWALITMVVYALVLHARFMPRMRGWLTFSVMSVYSFYTVLMTFFGVNYYLVGMHSYGNVSGVAPLAVALPTAIVVIITAVAIWRRRE